MIDGMDFEEFDQHVQLLRARAARSGFEEIEDFKVIEGLTTSAEEIADAERALGVTLPAQYKTFMMRYGGGQFGFLDLLLISATGPPHHDDVVFVSRAEIPDVVCHGDPCRNRRLLVLPRRRRPVQRRGVVSLPRP